MNTFTAKAATHPNETGKLVCVLQIKTNALVSVTHYCGSELEVTIHADSPQELKLFCDKIAEAGKKI